MTRTNCPACGAEVDLCLDMETQEIVPLEVNTDPSGEADRYRYVAFADKPLVRKVPPGMAGDFHPDHRFDCKDFNAGRTF